MKRFRLALIATLLAVTGCTSDVANRYYAPVQYPPRPQAEVQILNSRPALPFVIIADFQARGESAEGMQAQAAAIGADAVIITPLGGASNRSDEWAGNDSMANTYSHLVGTAIKYQ